MQLCCRLAASQNPPSLASQLQEAAQAEVERLREARAQAEREWRELQQQAAAAAPAPAPLTPRGPMRGRRAPGAGGGGGGQVPPSCLIELRAKLKDAERRLERVG